MGLRMKNFNILGVRWKVRLLEGRRGFTKNQNRGGKFRKRGGTLGQFTNLTGGLARKKGWCF